jgi:hypothetical protein
LNKIFEILIENEISINFKKAFIDYSSIQLLEQKIDFLKLFTNEEKLKTIFRLKFSRSLRQLEIYLNLIEWMRRYISDYFSIFQSLQNQKTLLLKRSSIVESIRRKFVTIIRFLNSTSIEIFVFNFIQKTLFKSRYLIHVDLKKQLYEDIDVNKKFEIDVMIYHVENDSSYDLKITTTWYSFKSKIQLILFLNRSLKSVEKNY